MLTDLGGGYVSGNVNAVVLMTFSFPCSDEKFNELN